MGQIASTSLLFLWFLLGLSTQLIQKAVGLSIPVKMDLDQTSKVSLSVLPLGASITWGVHSSFGNGYRKPLWEHLVHDPWVVNIVGSKHHGDMVHNRLEAHPGDTIDQVRAAASKSLAYRPNVILIEAGANDCRLEDDIPHVGNRMRTLIETLVGAADMEKTLVILSTLLPSGNTAIASHRHNVNNQYRELVQIMSEEGTSIVLADMDDPVPGGQITYPEDFTTGGVTDDTHPNDSGYTKMAYIWYRAIKKAYAADLISPSREPVVQ